MKPSPPRELLQLVGAFLASHGFDSTGRAFSKEQKSLGKSGNKNEKPESKLGKDTPSLLEIYQKWQNERSLGHGNAVAKSSASKSKDKSDSGSDSDDSDSESSSSSSDSDSSSSLHSEEESFNTKRKAKDAAATAVNGKKRKSKEGDEDSSSDSSSESSADDSPTPSKKQKVDVKKTVAIKTSKVRGSPSSSSSSAESSSEEASDDKSSDSDSSSDNSSSSGEDNGKTLKTPDRRSGSKTSTDSSRTLKGDGPAKSTEKAQTSSSDDSSDSSDSDDSSSNTSAVQLESKSKHSVKSQKRKRSKSPPPAEAAKPTAEANGKLQKKGNVPFNRIPKDTKVNPRMASNAYVPYDYAQRAHEDLIVTKGKGFTKEKNKKKRGSYRGGMIDTAGGGGIKFED